MKQDRKELSKKRKQILLESESFFRELSNINSYYDKYKDNPEFKKELSIYLLSNIKTIQNLRKNLGNNKGERK